jgi:hypothetical protein
MGPSSVGLLPTPDIVPSIGTNYTIAAAENITTIMENSPKMSKNIFDIDFTDTEAPAKCVAEKKKRKRAATTNIQVKGDRDGGFSDEYEPGPKARKQKTSTTPASEAIKKKKRAKTAPIRLDISSDEEIISVIKPTDRTKSTKTIDSGDPKNTKKAINKTYDFPQSPTIEEKDRYTTTTSEFTRKGIMVDMRGDTMVLPTQKKLEYAALSENSTTSSLRNPALDDIRLHSDDGIQFESTLPDPPEVYESLQNSNEISAPSPETSVAQTYNAAAIEPTSLIPMPQPSKAKPKKKRAITDTVLRGADFDSDHGIRIASEWRAAKGKGRQNLSDKQIQRKLTPESGGIVDIEMHSDGSVGIGGRGTTKKKRVPRKKKEGSKKERKMRIAKEEVQKQEKAQEDGDKNCDDAVIFGDELQNEKLGPGADPPPKLMIKLNINSKETRAITSLPMVEIPVSARQDSGSKILIVDSDDSNGELFSPPPSPSSPPNPEADSELKESVPKNNQNEKLKNKTRNSKKKIIVEFDKDDTKDDGYHIKNKESALPPPLPETTADTRAETKTAKRKRTKSGQKIDKKRTIAVEGEKKKDSKMVRSTEMIVDSDADSNDGFLEEKGKENETKSKDKTHDPPLPLPHDPPLPNTTTKISSPEKGKKIGPHSPLRGGKIPYRVGLSKRARIEPLLSIRKK